MMIDPTALLWVRRQKESADHAELAELAELCSELRVLQRELAPQIADNIARRNARMRQDGDHGFVMVQK